MEDRAAERALIERARAGDSTALEALLSAHQDRVFRTALGLCRGSEEAALEVVQDVLISACRHLDSFRGDSAFSTWLYRMTVNFARNRVVAEGRRAARVVSLDTSPRRTSSDEMRRPQAVELRAGPAEQVARAELIAVLHDRMGQLAPEFREVLVLRFIEDRDYDDIAATLEIPLGTVKSRINRGRRELRRLMADVLPGAAEEVAP
jgi:RNA polymerase sigma-70 factor (ECF subfamily)